MKKKRFNALGEARKFVYDGKLIVEATSFCKIQSQAFVLRRALMDAVSKLLRKAYKRGCKDINLDSCEQCHEYAGCSLIKSLAVGLKSNPLLEDFIPKKTEAPFQTDVFKVLPKHCHRYRKE